MTVPEEQQSRFQGRFAEYTRTLDCVHCGLCISHCPTYEVSGREADNPRGRIYAMRGFAEELQPLSRAVREHLDQCIVCRACETVCPAGIRMGEMMEGFREEMLRIDGPPGWKAALGHWLLRSVLPHRRRIAWASDLLWVWQALGLGRLADRCLPALSPALARAHALQPRIPRPRDRRLRTSREPLGEVHPSEGRARVRVGLFLGCIASEWFAETHRATIRVLQKNGCDVVLPDAQTCCGALHRHAGHLDDARALHARNVVAFRDARVDVVVVNAAGCGAALKEPPPGDLEPFDSPVRDVFELLDEIGVVEPEGSLPVRVVHDPPCHFEHAQRLGPEIVDRVLRRIPRLELVRLTNSDRCCGSGGVYNLLHPKLADVLLADKRGAILDEAPDVVVTGNPGCLLQIRSGLKGSGIRVLHPVDVLDCSYRKVPLPPAR